MCYVFCLLFDLYCCYWYVKLIYVVCVVFVIFVLIVLFIGLCVLYGEWLMIIVLIVVGGL